MRVGTRFVSAVLGGLLLFAVGCVGPGGNRPSAAMGGDSADFTLKNLAGQDMNFASLLKQNKAVLLNFWASWCPPCREEIPDLIALQEKYKGKSFTVLGVNVGESKLHASAFAEKAGINYPVVLDAYTEVAVKYGVVGIPTTFLVGSNGKILGEYHGVTPELFSDVEKALI